MNITTTVYVCGIDVEIEAEYTVRDETSAGLGPQHIEVESVTIIDPVAAIKDFSEVEDLAGNMRDWEILEQIREAAYDAVIPHIERELQ